MNGVEGCFELQMRHIAEQMNPISLTTLAGYLNHREPLPPKSVAVTFDDGIESIFLYAYPILKKYCIPATVFICPGYVESSSSFWWVKVREIIKKTEKKEIDLKIFEDLKGTAPLEYHRDKIPIGRVGQKNRAIRFLVEWVKSIKHKSIPYALERLQSDLSVKEEDINVPPVMTWSELREMSDEKVEIGAHTVNHPNLLRIDLSDASNEIKQSKSMIEEKIQKNVEGFAYPFGLRNHYDNRIRKLVVDAGFRYSCSARPGKVTSQTDVYSLPRICLSDDYHYLNILRLMK
jgi:peptidoglycan/xylan/chitin deacetylase (PgdA/CDA1 family)